MTESTNRLLTPLTPEQQQLVKLLSSTYREQRSWPPWQFVEQTMVNDGIDDVANVLATLPRVGNTNYVYGPSYGLTWTQGNFGASLQPNDPIGLTVAGLFLAGSEEYVGIFLRVLSMACEKIRNFVPNPQQAVTLELTSAEVYAELNDEQKALLTPQALYTLLEHEPAMWSGARGMTGEGEWRWEVTRLFRRYENVQTANDYIETVTKLAEESAQQVTQMVPFATPSALAGKGLSLDLSDWSGENTFLSPTVPLFGDGIDFELWEFVRPLVEAGRWEQVAREAAAFVETQTRNWTGSKKEILPLMSQLLNPKKVQSKNDEGRKQELNEAEGWHLLARGFFIAVRNHVIHNTVGMEEQFQYGLGTLGTASLLIRRIRTVVEARGAEADKSEGVR
jgi:hypothetical protein